MSRPDGLQHTLYEHDIPPDIAARIDSIYESAFCTIPYFKLFRKASDLNALVISTNDAVIVHVLVYVISGKEVTLMNELVGIGQEYLLHFADFVYARYPEVSTVNFDCQIYCPVQHQYPWRLWKTWHDIAIPLPDSMDSYNSSLSDRTRKNIKYYLSRLRKNYIDFAFDVTATQDIDPTVISRIIEMNRSRMNDANITSGYSSTLEKTIIEYCRYYGTVCTVSLQGKVAAGTICYEVGNQVYLETISHDTGYNKYNVGQVCLYLTIKHMIEKGRSSYHMLWGENDYKYRLLGIRHDLFYLSVYRSRAAKLSSVPKLLKYRYAGYISQLDYLANKYILKFFRSRR